MSPDMVPMLTVKDVDREVVEGSMMDHEVYTPRQAFNLESSPLTVPVLHTPKDHSLILTASGILYLRRLTDLKRRHGVSLTIAPVADWWTVGCTACICRNVAGYYAPCATFAACLFTDGITLKIVVAGTDAHVPRHCITVSSSLSKMQALDSS